MLSDKVWTTRKTRIYAEKRLNFRSELYQILIIWYSLILLFFATWTNFDTESSISDLLIIFGSFAILVFSVYIYSQKFQERASNMRNCYINLERIYQKLTKAEESNQSNQIDQLYSEYLSSIANIENHTEYDYLCFRYSQKNNKEKTTLPQFTKTDLLFYYFQLGFRWIGILVLLLLPFLLLIIWNLAQKYVSL